MKIERVLTIKYWSVRSFIPAVLVVLVEHVSFRMVLVRRLVRSFLGILITLPWQASIVRKLQELAAR